jgi:hypothetical protein
MIDIQDIYNNIDSPQTYYLMGALTGGFVISVGLFFYKEWKGYKKKAEEENKSKKNLEETI